MSWILITKIVFGFLVVFIFLYDVLALNKGGPDATFSRVILAWSRSYPLVPFAIGLLIGHLLTYQTPDN